MIHLKAGERIDDLQYKGLKIIQNIRNFCFGIDAVLLANFANIRKDDIVIDLGTGTAIIPILIAEKTNAKEIIGIEIQPIMAEMAKRSVELNNMQDKIQIIEADLKDCNQLFSANSFDIVTTNPPYMSYGGGLISDNESKAISRHEIKCTLEDIIIAASNILKIGGKFNMVHRPERITDIICFMRQYKIEPKRLRFIHPSYNKRANLILIEGIKGANNQLKILEPLYVYNEKGEYSKEINKIYERKTT